MAAKIIKELVVKVGEYTNNAGETKAQWLNIGRIMKNDSGSFMLLNRHFNPAGIEVDPGRDSVMVSLFDPKPRDQQPAPQAQDVGGQDGLDDEIPF